MNTKLNKTFSEAREKVSAEMLEKAKTDGVVQKKPNGSWGIISIDDGEWWVPDYESKENAEAALAAYHANKSFSERDAYSYTPDELRSNKKKLLSLPASKKPDSDIVDCSEVLIKLEWAGKGQIFQSGINYKKVDKDAWRQYNGDSIISTEKLINDLSELYSKHKKDNPLIIGFNLGIHNRTFSEGQKSFSEDMYAIIEDTGDPSVKFIKKGLSSEDADDLLNELRSKNPDIKYMKIKGEKVKDFKLSSQRSFSYAAFKPDIAEVPEGGNIGIEGVVGSVIFSVAYTHLFHLSTESYPAHIALQEYYERMPELVDDLAESYAAAFDDAVWTNYLKPESDPYMYLSQLYALIMPVYEALETPDKSLVENILLCIKSCIYKLTRMKGGQKVFNEKIFADPACYFVLANKDKGVCYYKSSSSDLSNAKFDFKKDFMNRYKGVSEVYGPFTKSEALSKAQDLANKYKVKLAMNPRGASSWLNG